MSPVRATRPTATRTSSPRTSPAIVVSTTSVPSRRGAGGPPPHPTAAPPRPQPAVAPRLPQAGGHGLGRGRLGARQQSLPAAEQGDPRAQRLPRGRHLAPDVPAPEHQQPAGGLLGAGGLA